MELAVLEALLARTIGLDPVALGTNGLRRAVERRRRALDLGREPLDAYIRLVRGSTEEFQELVEELVVTETWFFRDGRPFEELKRHASNWRRTPAATQRPFRALSFPCASGEEPYSIALSLLDLGLTPRQFAIDAIDLSARALERARQGTYGPRALRGVEPRIRDRYFKISDGNYVLDPEVRRCVRFLQGNLLDADSLRKSAPYDVIFCRNVLIYFDEAARQRAAATLDRLLASDGLLFVGHAERLPALEGRFAPHPAPGCFCYGKLASPPAPGASRGRPIVIRAVASPPAYPAAAAAPLMVQPSAPAPVPAPVPEPDLMAEAVARANQREYGEAAALCERLIQQRGPSAEACHLLGVIRQATGDLDDAERWLNKAVYLDADHAESLLALSLIAARRGDQAAAIRYRRRAERARQRKPSS